MLCASQLELGIILCVSHGAFVGWYAVNGHLLTCLSDLRRVSDSAGLWVNYVPAPLSLLAGENGTQGVYISQSAFNISKAMFGEDLQFWQNVLPGELEGHLDLVRRAYLVHVVGSLLIL